MITLHDILTSVLQRDRVPLIALKKQVVNVLSSSEKKKAASWHAVRQPCGMKQPAAKTARNWDLQSNHVQGTEGCQQPRGPGSGSFPSCTLP